VTRAQKSAIHKTRLAAQRAEEACRRLVVIVGDLASQWPGYVELDLDEVANLAVTLARIRARLERSAERRHDRYAL
jgi:hypothetical protein